MKVFVLPKISRRSVDATIRVKLGDTTTFLKKKGLRLIKLSRKVMHRSRPDEVKDYLSMCRAET